MPEPQLASVSNDKGVTLHVDPSDPRGSRVAETRGNASPDSLALWNHALRMHAWDVVVDASCMYGEMLVGADLPERSHIVAFEPEAGILPHLERTLGGWSRPVELVPAAAAVALEEALHGRGYRNACMRFAGEDQDAALDGSSGFLAGLERWIVMIEIGHLPPEQIAALVQHHNLYLHDAKTRHLIRVHSESPAVIHKLLASSWVYPQDALLMSSPDMVPQW